MAHPTTGAADRVCSARIELINGVGDATLKSLLDGLLACKPSVINDRERNEVLQKHQVIQDQVTCLLDMLLKKGEGACKRFLRILENVDPWKYGELYGAGDPATARPIQEADQSSTISYKKWICSQCDTVQEYNSEEKVLLTDRYTELLIVQKHREEKETENEISIKKSRDSEAYQSIPVEQFFMLDNHGDIPKAVILEGQSGYGKSITTQKIMHDWALDKLYQDRFELILQLRCKELNHLSGQLCLVDLVSCSQTFIPLLSQKLNDSPEKVLFLIDGFDELKFPMDENTDSPKAFLTPAPVEAILSALLKGLILPNCFLLITTRSTAAGKLRALLKCPHRSTEVLGFSENGVREYFERFYQDKQLSQRAFHLAKANETLFTSCFIPVMCWIVCTVFKAQLKDNAEMTGSLETTTSIFVHFVSTLLKHHCQSSSHTIPTMLRSLGRLAESGMLEQRVLFEEESVLSKISDPANVPFLRKFHLKKKVRKTEKFSFMHLSFQEFFSALYYILEQNEEKVKELLGSIHGDDVKSHLLPVIQFLFGLSNTEVMQELKYLKLTSSSSIRCQLEEWILGLIKENSDSKKADRTLFILQCLYELHEGKPCKVNHKEKPFVSRAMELWGDISFDSIPLTRTDCWVLLYCLQCCPTIKRLKLEKCNITAEKLRMLQPALSRSEELWLDVESLSDADVDALISSLGEGKALDYLGVSNSFLSDGSVKQVFSVLSRQKSVQNVMLSVKSITSDTVKMLLQFSRDTKVTRVHQPRGADTAESLCSSVSIDKGSSYFRMTIGHDADSATESQTLGLHLDVINRGEMYDFQVENFIFSFHRLKNFRDGTPGYHMCVDTLFSSMVSLDKLEQVWMSTDMLTLSWAKNIISFINKCTSLRRLQFAAHVYCERWEEGLLLQEAVSFLLKTDKRSDCSIKLFGKRCQNASNQCTEYTDRNRSCNKHADLLIRGRSCSDPYNYQQQNNCGVM